MCEPGFSVSDKIFFITYTYTWPNVPLTAHLGCYDPWQNTSHSCRPVSRSACRRVCP